MTNRSSVPRAPWARSGLVLAALAALVAPGCSKSSSDPAPAPIAVRGTARLASGAAPDPVITVVSLIAITQGAEPASEAFFAGVDSAGAWAFDAVPPDSYVVSVTAGGEADAETVVVAQASPAPIGLTLRPAGGFRGVTQDGSGQPVAGAIVLVNGLLAITDSDTAGNYLLEEVPPGRWELLAIGLTSGTPTAARVETLSTPAILDVEPLVLVPGTPLARAARLRAAAAARRGAATSR